MHDVIARHSRILLKQFAHRQHVLVVVYFFITLLVFRALTLVNIPLVEADRNSFRGSGDLEDNIAITVEMPPLDETACHLLGCIQLSTSSLHVVMWQQSANH